MKIKEVAMELGISPDTLRKWDKAGIIQCDRTALGHRIFTPESILQLQEVVKQRSWQRKANG